jgi:hypothetical protein
LPHHRHNSAWSQAALDFLLSQLVEGVLIKQILVAQRFQRLFLGVQAAFDFCIGSPSLPISSCLAAARNGLVHQFGNAYCEIS